MTKEKPKQGDNHITFAPPTPEVFSSFEFQGGAYEMKLAQMQGKGCRVEPTLIPSETDVIGVSDAERMKSVDRNSAEVYKLFPHERDSDARDAAYRYLMNRECVDNYSSSTKDDVALLEKTRPGIVKRLDAIVILRQKHGAAPGSHPEIPNC